MISAARKIDGEVFLGLYIGIPFNSASAILQVQNRFDPFHSNNDNQTHVEGQADEQDVLDLQPGEESVSAELNRLFKSYDDETLLKRLSDLLRSPDFSTNPEFLDRASFYLETIIRDHAANENSPILSLAEELESDLGDVSIALPGYDDYSMEVTLAEKLGSVGATESSQKAEEDRQRRERELALNPSG